MGDITIEIPDNESEGDTVDETAQADIVNELDHLRERDADHVDADIERAYQAAQAAQARADEAHIRIDEIIAAQVIIADVALEVAAENGELKDELAEQTPEINIESEPEPEPEYDEKPDREHWFYRK